MVDATLTGVLAAVLTPLNDDLAPDHGALALHCRWLLANGCSAVSVLGTTGEGNSFSVEERLGILDALAEAGIPGGMLLPGTGCCAVPDSVRLTAKAIEIDAAGVLMLPPFFYKKVSDDGVFAAYAEVVERIGDERLKIYLYHFPQISGVALSRPLIERLLTRYPDTFVGLKDSSGDGDGMIAAARAFPGFSVFTGSDNFLLPLAAAGGAGCITAVCNAAAPIAAEVLVCLRRGEPHTAARHQQRLEAVRRVIEAYPLTASLKALMARHTGDRRWRNIRPPLVPLAPQEEAELISALEAVGFEMPPLVP